MFSNKYILKILATVTVVTTIASFSDSDKAIAETSLVNSKAITLDVYKSPNCSCCKKWISHLSDNGLQSKVHNRRNISVIKEEKGIEPRYRSCHTAISNDMYLQNLYNNS